MIVFLSRVELVEGKLTRQTLSAGKVHSVSFLSEHPADLGLENRRGNSTTYGSSYKSFRLPSYMSYACSPNQPHVSIETKTLVHFYCFVFVQ